MNKKRPNIIFIVMDALRARNLSCYGYTRQTSPNIDSLSKEGILFEKAFSTNNSTHKSLLAILSGRHILLEKEQDILVTKKELNKFFSANGILISEILKKQNYKTFWLKEIHGWQKRGFDYYFQIEEGKRKEISFLKKIKKNQKIRDFFREIVHFMPKSIGNSIKKKEGRQSDEIATNKAIEIINNSKDNDPFFMWIDYNNTHIPYNPKEFTNKFTAEKKSKSFFKELKTQDMKKEMVSFFKGAFSKSSTFEDIIARYDSAIYYDDYLIGKIIKSLKKNKIFDNTFIFFFSDHGESFDTQRIFFNHHGLYDVCTNVPLIITGPNIPKNKKNNSFVIHEDIVPTILDLLNIDYNKEDFDGQSLKPLINKTQDSIRNYVFMEESAFQNKKAIRTKDYKYTEAASHKEAKCSICNEIHGGTIELYDLTKDPEEKINIAKENKEELIKLKTLLKEHIKDSKRLNEKRRIKNIFSNQKKPN
jgi:arylsulfatase A-like enzyme